MAVAGKAQFRELKHDGTPPNPALPHIYTGQPWFTAAFVYVVDLATCSVQGAQVMKSFTTHGVRSIKFQDGVGPGLVMLAYDANYEYIIQMDQGHRDLLVHPVLKMDSGNSGASAKYGLKQNGIQKLNWLPGQSSAFFITDGGVKYWKDGCGPSGPGVPPCQCAKIDLSGSGDTVVSSGWQETTKTLIVIMTQNISGTNNFALTFQGLDTSQCGITQAQCLQTSTFKKKATHAFTGSGTPVFSVRTAVLDIANTKVQVFTCTNQAHATASNAVYFDMLQNDGGAFTIQTYTQSAWSQCLGAHSQQQNIGVFLTLNSVKEYSVLTVNFVLKTLTTQTSGFPMTSLQNYDASSTANMAVWGQDNFFFSGTVNQIETSGTFTEPVGFVMSTTYNRGFSFKLLVSGATSDISSAVATGTLDNITGNPTVEELGGTTADLASQTNGYFPGDPSAPPNHFHNVKGLWAINTCSSFKKEYFDFSYCDYFKFLEPKKDSSGSLKVPLFELSSRYQDLKTFDCSASKEIDFSFVRESALKSVCFNKINVVQEGDALVYNEVILNDRLDPTLNPTDVFGTGPIPMISLDASQYKAKWTTEPQVATLGRPSNDYVRSDGFNFGVYKVETKLDVEDPAGTGDVQQTAIKAVNVAHKVVKIQIGTSFKLAYFPVLEPGMTEGRPEADLCNLKVECWTSECASFIHYNREAREWQYNQFDEGLKGDKVVAYIYVVTYECPTEYRRQVDTFEFQVTPAPQTVAYALPALPRGTLCKSYKKYLPKNFQMVGPCSDWTNEKKAESSLKLGEELRNGKHKHHKVSKAELKERSTFPKTWTQPQRETALIEARERVMKPKKACGVGSVKVGNTGQISINLACKVRFPSYMKEEVGAMQAATGNEKVGKSRLLADNHTMTGYGGGAEDTSSDPPPPPGGPGGPPGGGGGGPPGGGGGGPPGGGGGPPGGGGKGGPGGGGRGGPGGGRGGGKGGPGGGRGGGKGGPGGGRGGGKGGRGGKGPGGRGGPGKGKQGPPNKDDNEPEKIESPVAPVIEIPKVPTLEELKAACTKMQYWNDQEYACTDLEFYFGSVLDMISIKVKREDGTMIDIHHNADGRRLQRRKKKKKKVEKVVEAVVDNSPPITITKLLDNQIVLQMNYGELGSKFTRADQLVVSLAFYSFEEAFSDQDTQKRMVKQIDKAGKANAEQAAAVASAVTGGVAIGAAVGQIALAGALSQIWGMINGAQTLVHMPIFAAELPQGPMIVVNSILGVATFDLPKINAADFAMYAGMAVGNDKLFDLGKRDEDNQLMSDLPIDQEIKNGLLGETLNSVGYGSIYTSENMGSVFIFQAFTVVFLVFMILGLCTRRLHPCQARWNNKLQDFLCWNWCIRLILEAAMELSFCCILNTYYSSYDGTWAMKLNYCIAWFFAAALTLSPVLILSFYNWHFSKLADEEFEEKWGAPYESLNKESRWSLVYPCTFVVRRLVFAYICIFMPHNLFFQLAVQFHITVLTVMYLIECRPFEEPLLHKLEVMNECVNVLTIDVLFNMTTANQTEQAMDYLGFAFIGCIGVNLMIHMFFIVRAGCHDFKRNRKNKLYLKRYHKWYEALSEDQREKYPTLDDIKDDMDNDKGEMRMIDKKKNKFDIVRKATKRDGQKSPRTPRVEAGPNHKMGFVKGKKASSVKVGPGQIIDSSQVKQQSGLKPGVIDDCKLEIITERSEVSGDEQSYNFQNGYKRRERVNSGFQDDLQAKPTRRTIFSSNVGDQELDEEVDVDTESGPDINTVAAVFKYSIDKDRKKGSSAPVIPQASTLKQKLMKKLKSTQPPKRQQYEASASEVDASEITLRPSIDQGRIEDAKLMSEFTTKKLVGRMPQFSKR